MKKINFANKWVIVTGASSGLGEALALYLATTEKANVVIAARRKERLQDLKDRIESVSDAKVVVIEVDLATKEGNQFLFDQATKVGDIFAIINNAGITSFGRTHINDLAWYEKMIDLNFKGTVRLSLLFLDYFDKLGRGAILNITSVGSVMPMPYQSVYSATKHASQAFTESLRGELKGKRTIICSYSPGGIATEMLTTSGLDKLHDQESIFNMDPAIVARKAIKSFKKRKLISYPGFINKIMPFLSRFFPKRLIIWAAEKVYTPPE